MVVYDECNFCNRIKLWYSRLTDEKKEALELSLKPETLTDEIGICENCGKRNYGDQRVVFDDRWICNICYWRHCFGRISIK